ncbi:hypothetical protein [Thiothrix unzii]|uniref:hypothetical protein n=1 Tax=Thiothrix unzii TaxID=111769 RepID=UPI002A36270E|nr:hypothetical protein [Thiothrix unzii]MDX9990265.1 hypothetical protein [Thiothrix unzii]
MSQHLHEWWSLRLRPAPDHPQHIFRDSLPLASLPSSKLSAKSHYLQFRNAKPRLTQ